MSRPLTFIEHPLSWIFSHASSVAVLRALKDSKEGMSGRAVAREAGINHQTCAVALIRLEALGVLSRRGSGKTQLISLNTANSLVRDMLLPLFRGERELAAHIRADIRDGIAKRALCATIFGSAARRESKPGSDVDLLLITAPQTKTILTAAADEFSRAFTLRYGIRLSPIILTVREAESRAEKSDPLLKNIMRDGIDIGQTKLGELLK